MGAKKGKALALELMDDLLKEEGSAKEIEVEGITDVREYKSDFGEAAKDVHLDRTEISDPQAAPATGDPAATLHESASEDRTERIPAGQVSSSAGDAEDRVRASVGRYAPYRSSGPATATEAALAQSESLRIAQARLIEFEQEIERLRLQNEELAAAGETLRRRTDELVAANQKRESDYQNLRQSFEQEKELLLGSKEALQRDLATLRQKNEELELRISTNIQKIRVRERELENRLELVKMESAALIRSKDEMILELKRNIDQLNLELNNYRSKNQELNRQSNDKQEQLRRTVKALRLALSMLEGEEETPAKPAVAPQRKAK
jgi:hypothetical protein